MLYCVQIFFYILLDTNPNLLMHINQVQLYLQVDAKHYVHHLYIQMTMLLIVFLFQCYIVYDIVSYDF